MVSIILEKLALKYGSKVYDLKSILLEHKSKIEKTQKSSLKPDPRPNFPTSTQFYGKTEQNIPQTKIYATGPIEETASTMIYVEKNVQDKSFTTPDISSSQFQPIPTNITSMSSTRLDRKTKENLIEEMTSSESMPNITVTSKDLKTMENSTTYDSHDGGTRKYSTQTAPPILSHKTSKEVTTPTVSVIDRINAGPQISTTEPESIVDETDTHSDFNTTELPEKKVSSVQSAISLESSTTISKKNGNFTEEVSTNVLRNPEPQTISTTTSDILLDAAKTSEISDILSSTKSMKTESLPASSTEHTTNLKSSGDEHLSTNYGFPSTSSAIRFPHTVATNVDDFEVTTTKSWWSLGNFFGDQPLSPIGKQRNNQQGILFFHRFLYVLKKTIF